MFGNRIALEKLSESVIFVRRDKAIFFLCHIYGVKVISTSALTRIVECMIMRLIFVHPFDVSAFLFFFIFFLFTSRSFSLMIDQIMTDNFVCGGKICVSKLANKHSNQ